MRFELRVARFRIPLLVAALVASVAATAQAAVVRHAIRLGPAPDPHRTIEVLEFAQAPPRPVHVLGVIRLESSGPASLTEQPDHAFWARMFQAPARSLGADAVVGLRFTQARGEATQRVSALAVEYVDAPLAQGCGCVLLVPPARVPTGTPEPDRSDLSTYLQVEATAALERKGWYVVWPADTSADAARVGKLLLPIGQVIDAELEVAVDTVVSTRRPAPDPRSIASEPEVGHSMTTRTRAVLIGAHGDTTWVAAHEGSGWRFSDLGPAEEVDRFEIYAEQRGRELKTVLTGAPGPRR